MSNNIKQKIIGEHTEAQVLFVRYFVAVLVDLIVLNLFEEYWSAVIIQSFTISLLTAILLQILLKITIKVEHKISIYFKSKSKPVKILGYIVMYIVLLIAKISILEAINLIFGDKVQFTGLWHGVIAFLTVVIVMLTIEQIVVKIYFALGVKKIDNKININLNK